MQGALGLIECIGFTTAMAAADAATKAAVVTVLGSERVIGVGKAVSVVVKLQGDVASVQAAVSAGQAAAERVGKVVSVHVIPRPHQELERLILSGETRASLVGSPTAPGGEAPPKTKENRKQNK